MNNQNKTSKQAKGETSQKDAKDGVSDKKETKDKKDKKSSKKKMPLKTKLALLAGLLILILAAGFVGLYVYSPIGKYTRPIFKKVPYPVAVIGTAKNVITSSELISNVDAVKKFYESQDFSKIGMRVDFSTQEGKNRLKVKQKDILDKLIEDKIIEKLANEQGIVISSSDAQSSIDEKIGESGDKRSLELNLNSLYGWSIDQFRDKVVVYQMYSEKLFEWYASNITNQKGYAKIMKAKEELNNDGSNFAQVARDYSEGESASNDGEVGWLKRDQMVDEVSDVASNMNNNEISDIIISPLGFHIIQVLEKRNETQDDGTDKTGAEEIKVRQIFVRGESFLDWIAQEKKDTQVYVLMKDYYWDQGEGRVRFSDSNLEKMESNLRMLSDGDPSL